MDLRKLDTNTLAPCDRGQHNFVPIGEPQIEDGVVRRAIVVTFCRSCGNQSAVTLAEEPLKKLDDTGKPR